MKPPHQPGGYRFGAGVCPDCAEDVLSEVSDLSGFAENQINDPTTSHVGALPSTAG
jgi:hypothetical protein